jgi:hypothetical protein
MLELSFTSFNLVEGIFWMMCAYISVSFLPKRIVSPRLHYAIGFDFLLFSISDFVEAYYPVSFLEPGGEWLLIWKVLCIGIFIGLFSIGIVSASRKG